MEKYACCNWGLDQLSGEVTVRFIALLSLFDRTQGRVRGKKSGSTDLKYHLDPAAWGATRQDKRNEELGSL